MVNTKNIGYLFDLDGVLIDSEHEYTRIWERIEQHYPTGVPNFPLAIKGETLTYILSQFYPDAGTQTEVVAMLKQLEGRMRYDWLPGAKELLLQLRSAGLPRVLVTSSNEYKMAHLRRVRPDLLPLFDEVVTADRITRSKPDPEGYLLGAQLIGVPPEQCIVFEDAIQGAKAGKSAGCHVVGISGTLGAERLSPYVDEIINDLSEYELR